MECYMKVLQKLRYTKNTSCISCTHIWYWDTVILTYMCDDNSHMSQLLPYNSKAVEVDLSCWYSFYLCSWLHFLPFTYPKLYSKPCYYVPPKKKVEKREVHTLISLLSICYKLFIPWQNIVLIHNKVHKCVHIQPTFKLSTQSAQSLCHDLLYSPALSPGAMRGQAVASNATASTNTGRENVVGVKVFPTVQFVRIQVSLVLSILSWEKTLMVALDLKWFYLTKAMASEIHVGKLKQIGKDATVHIQVFYTWHYDFSNNYMYTDLVSHSHCLLHCFTSGLFIQWFRIHQNTIDLHRWHKINVTTWGPVAMILRRAVT